jgi:hypothetical protein
MHTRHAVLRWLCVLAVTVAAVPVLGQATSRRQAAQRAEGRRAQPPAATDAGTAAQAAPGAEAGAGRVVDLPAPGFAFAAAPERGHLAALEPSERRVTLYRGLGGAGQQGEPVHQEVGESPLWIVHKSLGEGGVFLVLCAGDKTLHVLDDDTLRPASKIAVTGRDPRGLAAPAGTASPWAFYLFKGNRGYYDVAAVDLLKRADVGQVQLDNDCAEISVSTDGTYLYTRTPGQSPSGFRCYKLLPPKSGARAAEGDAREEQSPGAPRAVPVVSKHDDSGTYVPDTFGQYCASGRTLHSADLLRSLAQLEAPVALFHPRRALFFSLEEDEIVACSYNTFQTLSRVDLPAGIRIPPPPDAGRREGYRGAARARRPGSAGPNPNAAAEAPAPALQEVRLGYGVIRSQPTLLADVKNDSLLVCYGAKVGVVPLSAFNAPAEPVLAARVQGKTSVNVGEPVVVTIKPLDPAIRLELAGGPAGMKLAGDKLTWTPGGGDVGSHQALVRLAAGKLSRTQPVDFAVRLAAVDLGFVANDVKLSADGKLAVVLRQGTGDGRDPFPRPGQQQPPPGCRVAVVDLEKLSVVADRAIPVNATSVAIGGGRVLLALQDSDAFYVLDAKNLADVKRVFTSGRVNGFVNAGDKALFVQTWGQTPTAWRFALPDVRPLDPPGAVPPNWNGQGTRAPQPVGQDWYFEGVVYDREMGKALMLMEPPGFATVATANYNRPQRWGDPNQMPPPTAAFGTTLQMGQLRRGGGQSVGDMQALDHVMLPDVPAAAALVRPEQQPSPDQAWRDRADVVLRELLTGQASARLTLFDEPALRSYQDGNQSHKLAAAPGTLVALVRDRLYAVPTRATEAAKFPVPLHVVLRQSALVLDPRRPTVLTHEVRGGKRPAEFALAWEMPGLSMDKEDGKVTVDPAPFLARAPDMIIPFLQSYQYQPQTRPAGGGQEQVVASYQRMLARQFVRIMGREPKGVPVLVPVGLVVRDAEQQTAVMDYAIFLEVPEQSVISRLREMTEQATAAARPVVPAPATRPAGPSPETEALQRRIEELERRNQQLEAQVQLLKELVGQNRGGNRAPAPSSQENPAPRQRPTR